MHILYLFALLDVISCGTIHQQCVNCGMGIQKITTFCISATRECNVKSVHLVAITAASMLKKLL